MIIPNGTIELKVKIVSGIDPVTGYPVKASDVSWSAPIDCQYSAIKYDKLGKVNGEHFIVAQYSILIEDQQLGDFEQIRLTDGKSGNSLGEFSVMQVEQLDAVCELKILV